MATYFITSAGLSMVLIGVLSIAGWLIGAPELSAWARGSMPMAPVTAVLSVSAGASVMFCAPEKRTRWCSIGTLLSALSLVASVTLLVLRAGGWYFPAEHLGLDISGSLNGAPLGFISPLTAGSFAAASVAFMAQHLPYVERRVRLVAALSTALAISSIGFASLLAAILGYPVIAGPGFVPVATSTSVVLLLLGSSLAAMAVQLSDRSSSRAAARDRSWRPLSFAFLAIVAITAIAGYAFYRQEEQEIQSEISARFEGIRVIPASDAATMEATQTAGGAVVRTYRVPNSDLSLMSVTGSGELRAALWERLSWVLAFSAMLLVSAGAILALMWRTHRATQYRERAGLAEALRLQAIRVSDLVSRSPAVLYTLRVRGLSFVPTNISANVERILGYTVAEALDEDWFPANLFPEDRAAALAAAGGLGAADELVTEFRFLRKDGSVLWVSNQMTVTRREAGQPVEITGAWHDITERRKAEEALRVSEERLRLALAAAEQGLWDENLQTGETIVSPEFATMLGYDPADFQETDDTWRARLHPDDRESAVSAFYDYIEGRVDSYCVESRQQTKSGEWKWILTRGSLIGRSSDGRPRRMLGIYTDITARKTAELRSERLAEQREALLKEVHHRVKNNLQVISSLLRLERDRHDDSTVRTAMSEMQLRILSMALLHETLYRSDDLGHVDLAAYLTDLGHQVFRSAAPSTGRISLQLNLTPVLVDMDHAIPCGLLVNEVLANCLKHAFPGGRDGVVTIDLRPVQGEPLFLLRISDDGVGLPADFETRQTTSLGVHLVRALAGQLNADLSIDAGPGAAFSITFATNGSAVSEDLS